MIGVSRVSEGVVVERSLSSEVLRVKNSLYCQEWKMSVDSKIGDRTHWWVVLDLPGCVSTLAEADGWIQRTSMKIRENH